MFAERTCNKPILPGHRGRVRGVLSDTAGRSVVWSNQLLSCHQPCIQVYSLPLSQWWMDGRTDGRTDGSIDPLIHQSIHPSTPCGLWDSKNWAASFPGRMSYKATKPGLVAVLYLSMRYTVVLFIRAPFYVLLVFVGMCSVFWLFWLSYQYLPSDWLERLLWGSLIVARGASPESPGRRVHVIFLVYCIASLLYYVFVLSLAHTWQFSCCYGAI